MREFTLALVAFLIGAITLAFVAIHNTTKPPEPSTPPAIEVTAPGCEWGGPYPGLVKGTEMWIVICAEGGGDG